MTTGFMRRTLRPHDYDAMVRDAAKDCIEEYLFYGSVSANHMRDEKAREISKAFPGNMSAIIDDIDSQIAETI